MSENFSFVGSENGAFIQSENSARGSGELASITPGQVFVTVEGTHPVDTNPYTEPAHPEPLIVDVPTLQVFALDAITGASRMVYNKTAAWFPARVDVFPAQVAFSHIQAHVIEAWGSNAYIGVSEILTAQYVGPSDYQNRIDSTDGGSIILADNTSIWGALGTYDWLAPGRDTGSEIMLALKRVSTSTDLRERYDWVKLEGLSESAPSSDVGPSWDAIRYIGRLYPNDSNGVDLGIRYWFDTRPDLYGFQGTPGWTEYTLVPYTYDDIRMAPTCAAALGIAPRIFGLVDSLGGSVNIVNAENGALELAAQQTGFTPTPKSEFGIAQRAADQFSIFTDSARYDWPGSLTPVWTTTVTPNPPIVTPTGGGLINREIKPWVGFPA